MRNIFYFISLFFLLTLGSGCALTESILKTPSKPEPVDPRLEQYLESARQFENRDKLLEAFEQYQLALTVDSKNQTAKNKIKELKSTFKELAEEHYLTGLSYYQNGKYHNARKEFLLAIQYQEAHPLAIKMLKEPGLNRAEVVGFLIHKIQTGESVSILARKYYGDPMKFQIIAEYNQMEDAAKVRVGQELKIPIMDGLLFFKGSDQPVTLFDQIPDKNVKNIINIKNVITHVIKSGESLSGLALHYYGSYDNTLLLAQYNEMAEGENLKVGKEIKVPEIDGLPFNVKKDNVELADVKEPETVKEKEIELEEEIPEEITAQTPEEMPEMDQTAQSRERAIELFKSKNYEEAITAFEEILTQNPDDPTSLEYVSKSHFEKGVIFFGKKDYLNAIDEFKAAIRYNEQCEECIDYIKRSENEYMDSHYKEGLVNYKSENLEKAIEEWKLVSDIDPNYKDVAEYLKTAQIQYDRLKKIIDKKTKEGNQ